MAGLHAAESGFVLLHRGLELIMAAMVDHTTLHRTAKYFMDSGRAESHDAAVSLLRSFGLTILVGEEIVRSRHHQVALFTLINAARRTFLGGIDVVCPMDGPSLTGLSQASVIKTIKALGATVVETQRHEWPAALIGDATPSLANAPCWQLTWEGWRGGVTPQRERRRLDESRAIALAPAFAAATCAAEAFAFHAADHPYAGRRAAGLSLWEPEIDWIGVVPGEPEISYLPSKLWIIGLGNLGQALSWLLASLPYRTPGDVEVVLQDFDRMAVSNVSTSILTTEEDIGKKKTRVVSAWLEARGFNTALEERRFCSLSRRTPDEPGIAFCGVDNAATRLWLEKAGFDLVIEAGLGAGPNAFRSISIHTFPSTRSPEQIWSRFQSETTESLEEKPAYRNLSQKGMDDCGLAQLASRTVGVPFVSVMATALMLAETIRRLNGGRGFELAAGSAASLADFEVVHSVTGPYPGGFVNVDKESREEVLTNDIVTPMASESFEVM